MERNMHQARSFAFRRDAVNWNKAVEMASCFLQNKSRWVRRSNKSGFIPQNPDRRNKVEQTGAINITLCRRERGCLLTYGLYLKSYVFRCVFFFNFVLCQPLTTFALKMVWIQVRHLIIEVPLNMDSWRPLKLLRP